MTEDIGDRITKIIAEQALLDPSEVTAEKTLEDLGIDSLGVVESIFAIEEAFDISVPFDANNPQDSAFDISSVGSITAAVKQLMQEQNTA